MRHRMMGSLLLVSVAALLASVGAAGEWLDVGGSAELSRHEGRRVRLVGRVSATPWQHLMGAAPGKSLDTYFDTADRGQIVVYSDRPIECRGEMQIWGTVVRVHGGPKRPDAPGKTTKMPEEYEEHHLAADGWKCLK